MGSDACESSGPVQVGDVRCRRVRACVAALQLDVDGQVFEAGHELAGLVDAVALDGDLAGHVRRLPNITPSTHAAVPGEPAPPATSWSITTWRLGHEGYGTQHQRCCRLDLAPGTRTPGVSAGALGANVPPFGVGPTHLHGSHRGLVHNQRLVLIKAASEPNAGTGARNPRDKLGHDVDRKPPAIQNSRPSRIRTIRSDITQPQFFCAFCANNRLRWEERGCGGVSTSMPHSSLILAIIALGALIVWIWVINKNDH